MSEPEVEPVQPDEQPPEAEPIEQPGGPQEEPEPQPDVRPGPHPVTPPETPEDIDELYAKLSTRAKNYVKSVSEMLEGKSLPAAVCEMCVDCYPGLRWIEPQDETHAQLIAIAGAMDEESLFNDDPHAIECEDCKGYGRVKLPSHVFTNKSRKCRRCNGAGYLERNAQSGTPQAPTPADTNGTSEVPEGIPENDPAIVSLLERGYMVTKIPSFVPDSEQS